MSGTVHLVGIGPGSIDLLTPDARRAIDGSTVVVGYEPYLRLIAPLLEGKRTVAGRMTREEERCRAALDASLQGETVSLVSSGDAGVYGMAGLLLEMADRLPDPPPVEIHPGVTAVTAAAARLGAPLVHDFAVISLSDLLTPWGSIRERIRGAASTDFVVALYNPRSRGRVRQLEEAVEIVSLFRAPTTPAGIVRNAYRPGEERIVTTLGDLLSHPVDMTSIVIVGNSRTRLDRQGRMVTPRGYGEGRRSAPPLREKGLRPLMVCGTGSDVGKSVIAAGICRIFADRGVRVSPFKSQNMALNAAVTPDGGEIGRAQAEQARACRILPTVHMNPILLKPTGERRSQVILQGRVVETMTVDQYHLFKPLAFERAMESFRHLRDSFDLVVMEGAGSIVEINLKEHDIANLRVAEHAGAAVILVADIDRGGVFAQIVGTWELLEPAEREMVVGFVINRFRGDPSLLTSGIEYVQTRTGRPVLGVIPWLDEIGVSPEDSQSLGRLAGGGAGVTVGVLRTPRISNFDELVPLRREPDVTLRFVEHPADLEDVDLLILPGSRSTVDDLLFLRERGLVEGIRSFGGPILGICGGFQMLGKVVRDPSRIESTVEETEGIGLIDMETVLEREKTTHRVRAVVSSLTGDEPLEGYEIHHGRVTLSSGVEPFLTIVERSGMEVLIPDGGSTPDGRVRGSHVHGLMENDRFRRRLLDPLREKKGLPLSPPPRTTHDPFDRLARHLEKHLDLSPIFRSIGYVT